MNNLYNIPGLIFKDGEVFHNDNRVSQCIYQLWCRSLVIELECPHNPWDIKDLIKAYDMTNSKDWGFGIDEKRYRKTITGELFDVEIRLDVKKSKFIEMLDLTGCFQANGTINFDTKGKDPVNFVYEGGK